MFNIILEYLFVFKLQHMEVSTLLLYVFFVYVINTFSAVYVTNHLMFIKYVISVIEIKYNFATYFL